MRIAHIIADIREEASGPSNIVPGLVEAQRNLGHDADLHTLDAPTRRQQWVHTYARDRRSPRRLGMSRALKAASRGLIETCDVVHVHGLWMMPNVYPFRPAAAPAVRILSPHGTLMPWAMDFHAWRKQAFWMGAQRVALRADGIHATSQAELDALRALPFRGSPFVIPNGVQVNHETNASRHPLPAQRDVLYLGRLHPVKGLDLLVEAWSAVESKRPGWSLRIVGRDEEGTKSQLESLVKKLGLDRVSVEPPLYGSDKEGSLAAARVFVLPTRSENFGVTVLEALAQGTPAIVTKGAPWKELDVESCGWWIDISVDAIAAALLEATGLSDTERIEMGERGRRWARQQYSWEAIAGDMVAAYEGLMS